MVKLLRDKKDSMVLGRQVGNVTAREIPDRKNRDQPMFQHNDESFKKMWEEVGVLTGTKWRVDAELLVVEDDYQKQRGPIHGPGFRRLRFSVFRE